MRRRTGTPCLDYTGSGQGRSLLVLRRHGSSDLPPSPVGREQDIAEHACQKYSGRVGRSADARSLAEEFIRLAVIAHIRHAETNYDELLSRGMDRWLAREQVEDRIDQVLEHWRGEQSFV